MSTSRKSKTMRFLERLAGEPLTLGEALMSIRLGEELSQTEFSRQLSISRSHLCDIEKGRKSVSPARAAKWARMLGYSEEQFVRLALQDLVEQAGLDMTVHIEAAEQGSLPSPRFADPARQWTSSRRCSVNRI